MTGNIVVLKSNDGRDTQTSLYRHFCDGEQLLYVGISLSTLTRLGQHAINSHWYDKIAKVTIEHFPTRKQALTAERKAIIQEQPLHNIHHAGCIPEPEVEVYIEQAKRVTKARDDFITRLVNIDILYTSIELSQVLKVTHKQLKAMIDEGDLNYIGLTGQKDKTDTRKFFITGFQVIDFLEFLELQGHVLNGTRNKQRDIPSGDHQFNRNEIS